MDAPPCRPYARQVWFALPLIVWTAACSRSPQQTVLTAEMPLHLEDHLEAATFSEVSASDLPKTNLPKPVEWRFDQPQPDWKATPLWNTPSSAPVLARRGDGLRVTLTDRQKMTNGSLRGFIRLDVPDWDRADWAEVVIRARADAASSVNVLGLGFNLRDGRGEAGTPAAPPFQFAGEQSAIVRDGIVRTYRLRINVGGGIFEGPWRQLMLMVGSPGAPGSVDLLSVTVVPKSAVPAPTVVEWRFDEPQPDWKPRQSPGPNTAREVTRTTDALRVTLAEGSRRPDGTTHGGTVYVDLPGWRREEWAHILVRARTSSVTTMALGLNLSGDATQSGFARNGGTTPIVSDGTVQTYQIRPNWGGDGGDRFGPWLRLGLGFRASEPGSIDILSVSVVPITALYAGDRAGFRAIAMAGTYRRSVFAHAPAGLQFRVRVPEDGRLHTALGVLSAPVDFRVVVRSANDDATTLLSETHTDPELWAERSVDLSRFAGQTVSLGLETGAAGGASPVAFWGSPTVTGPRRTDKPNVILYVIDGGGADYMSVYGYNRRTTPNLEKLAAEGVVFERAYSNASSTYFSVPSFMTSLQSSVLGKVGPHEPIREPVLTMAQRFHRAGYQTAAFSFNTNAVATLEQGADLVPGFRGLSNAPTSSAKLHQMFWSWRDWAPAQPYWVHIQTTDVHAVGRNTLDLYAGIPVAPFGGLFVSPQDVITLRDWSARVAAGGGWITSDAFTTGAVNRSSFLALFQGMYDEQMANNDHQLGRLIDRLKASGEWQNTVLIVAADHSVAGSFTDTAIGRLDSLPAGWTRNSYAWERPMFRPTVGRVPLIVSWPGRIAGGRRFDAPVSLIDVLPTVLDLAGLPMPDVMQGQSLSPLLRGQPGWTPRPVIFDEFEANAETGELSGAIEVVDGRWGASLWIGPPPANPANRRPWPILLFDLWEDPLCIAPVNQAHPDLVKRFTAFLEATWKDHRALATQFKPGPKVALTPEQLERLRALGYIR